jgi:hypothetical protein
MLDERRGRWRHYQHTAARARRGDPQGGVAAADEPSADDRQSRHVGARGAHTHTDPICKVADPHLINERGEDQTATQQDCPRTHDTSRPEAVAESGPSA